MLTVGYSNWEADCDDRFDELADTAVLDEGIKHYKDAGAEIKKLKGIQDKIKGYLVLRLTQCQLEEYVCATGKARFKGGHVSVSYDAEALDVLCRDDPELRKRLAPYRKESVVNGNLTIT